MLASRQPVRELKKIGTRLGLGAAAGTTAAQRPARSGPRKNAVSHSAATCRHWKKKTMQSCRRRPPRRGGSRRARADRGASAPEPGRPHQPSAAAAQSVVLLIVAERARARRGANQRSSGGRSCSELPPKSSEVPPPLFDDLANTERFEGDSPAAAPARGRPGVYRGKRRGSCRSSPAGRAQDQPPVTTANQASSMEWPIRCIPTARSRHNCPKA